MKGWIYFARFGIDGPIKIGRAGNPRSRVGSLTSGSPTAITLLGAALSDRVEEEELEIHQRLQASCVRGEWFDAQMAIIEMASLGKRLVSPEGLKTSRALTSNRRGLGQRNQPPSNRRGLDQRNHQLTVRIPLRILRALEAQAAAECRTVSDVLNKHLEDYCSAKRTGRR